MLKRRQAAWEEAGRGRSAAALPIARPAAWLSQRARGVHPEAFLAAAVIIGSFFVALLWADTIPFRTGPDEIVHFDEARFIAEHNRFPVFDKEPDLIHTTCRTTAGSCYTSYATYPGLNYAISAGFMKLQHALTGEPYSELHFAARLTSVLSIPVYLFFLWKISQLLLIQRMARVTALMLGAFIPQVTFIGGYVNADAFSLAIGAAVTYLSVRLLCDGYSRFMPLYSGVALGLLALARAYFFPLFGLFAVAWAFAAFRAWREDGRVRRVLFFSVATVAIAVVVGGWWYIRNFQLYGDALGLDTMTKAIETLAPDRLTLADKGWTFTSLLLDDADWRQLTFRSFWGVFGWLTVFLNSRIYVVIQSVLVVAAAGLIVAALKTLIAAPKALTEHGRKVWQ